MTLQKTKEFLKGFFKTQVPEFFKKKVPYFFKNEAPVIVKTKIPQFLKRNFEITSTKASRITGLVFCAVLLLLTVLNATEYTSQAFRMKWVLLAAVMAVPFIIGVTIAYSLEIKNMFLRRTVYLLSFLVLPLITVTMTECLNDVFIYDMTHLGFVANYTVVLVMHFIVMALTGSLRVSILVVNPILFGLAVAHSYLMDFRGSPFLPMDFLSITTAAGVANTYNYTLTYKVMTALFIFIFLVVIGIKAKYPRFNLLTKIISRTFMATFAAVLLILFYGTNFFADMGIKPDFWNQARGYHNYGFVWNFFCNTKYLYVTVPNGYDPNEVESLVNENVEEEEEENTPIVPAENAPNVIVIMNESLSDLSVLGDLQTNEDYMPFMRSLTENTIKGNLYVPVIGAGTSNTEFEFITGHSTAFLPSGSNAYMLYIKNPIASLVSTLEGQGYSSYALHPYFAAGWNRPTVYENLGFNNYTFLEDIMDISLMTEYQDNGSDPNYLQGLVEQVYPERENMLLRQYISDDYNYKVLIEDFENRDTSVPYFAFNVTMQNHGGYTMSCVNFNESIFATSTSKAYNKVNKYLSLVKASDDAFKELVEYFENVDEPTIICMFGDHQPSVETAFVREIMGVSDLSNLTLEQEQARHTTQFYIWANYDIEEKVIDKMSSNYLSAYLTQVAGLKMTEYDKYLLKVFEVLPVIDTVGYIDAEGNYYSWSDASSYTGMLSEMEKIQYNNIFDYENRDNAIFYLEGYTPDEPKAEEEEDAVSEAVE